MKLRFSLLSAACAVWLALIPAAALRAQDPAPETNDKSAAVAPAAPAVDTAPEAPAAPSAPETVPPPPPPAPPAAPTAPEWINRGEVFVFGNDVVIRENERASKVVAIGGDIDMRGRVDGEVAAIGGDVKIDGPVGKVTAILGEVTMGPRAKVAGETVAIGGDVENPSGVPLHGKLVEVAPFLPKPWALLGWCGDVVTNVRLLSPHIVWPWYVFGAGTLFFLLLAAAFGRGVNACARSLEERPGATLTTSLALLPLLPFFTLLLICTVIGIILLPFLAVAVLFAVAFGKAAVLVFLGRSLLRAFGSAELAERAWLTVLIGAALLAVLYCVPVLGLLVWTLTTWIGLGMVVSTIMEKRRREKAAAAAAAPAPRSRFAAMAPATVSSPIGFVAPVAPAVAASGALVPEAATPSVPFDRAAAESTSAESEAAAVPPVITPPPAAMPPPMGPAAAPTALALLTLPRADFWVRLGALVIDIVLVAIVGGMSMMVALLPFPLLFGGYMFAFWLWRGTTIGGIVFNLKVVRLDGRPVDGATAAVRTLVGFLSAVTLVGFLWCLWDEEWQTWHDKVAGTVVVRVPKATPLV